MHHFLLFPTAALLLLVAGSPQPGDVQEKLVRPPQDIGLPYTRSAQGQALAKIQETVAVFAGSRYAYVKGFRVRLDEADLLGGAARVESGKILVPNAFAPVLDLKEVDPPAAPAYLKTRWVYSLGLPAAPAGWTDLEALARKKGFRIFRDPRGLLLISPKEVAFSPAEKTLLDSVITLFDTPEKYADTSLPTKYIPTLKAQGVWTQVAQATPAQLTAVAGPETTFPEVPESEYNLAGFNGALLGAKVPPPGVYPRVLFSPEDIPALAARIKGSKIGQMSLIEMKYLFEKSWWDPQTSDGGIFAKLARGEVAGLDWDAPPGTPAGAYPQTFKGEKLGIFTTHVAYIPQCLTSMALYCLITGDETHGRQAAAAIAQYYKLREPLLDEINSISDSEYGSSFTRPDGSVVVLDGLGSTTHWRTEGGRGGGIGANMDLGLALDFAGKWMTADEKDSMRRYIAKATYGKRSYGQDGPRRWRDINWVTWDLSDYLAATSIEGLEGFDPEVVAAGAQTVRAFLNFGIDPAGIIYESNGKTPGGLQFLTLALVSLARRGDNQWGHPHWRKFLEGEVQTVSPSGRVNVTSGTQYVPFSGQYLSLQFVDEMKAFFPGDRCADYLLGRAELYDPTKDEIAREWNLHDFDPTVFQSKVASVRRLRLPGPTYPGMAHSILYDSDYQPVSREALNLPLDFSTPVHGLFSSASDRTPQAAWINMLVRPDHYLGAGHHHADAGMFHFSALGVDWFTQGPYPGVYDGKYYNLVQVDGHSEPESISGAINGYNGRATYLGAVSEPNAAAATADLTYAYSYRWLTQPPQVWDEATKKLGWELDPNPDLLNIFAGTDHYKMRPWWPTSNFSNYFPTCRAPFNPMRYVYRTVGMVRGSHPYSFVVDDLAKDQASHLYQWVAMLNGGVEQGSQTGLADNEFALTALESASPDNPNPTRRPTLLVVDLGAAKPAFSGVNLIDSLRRCAVRLHLRLPTGVNTADGPAAKDGKLTTYNRFLLNRIGPAAHFRVLLLPVAEGAAVPTVTYAVSTQTATIDWPDQHDQLVFSADATQRTHTQVVRSGTVLLSTK